MERGRFILFEGIDRSGKTSQSKYLLAYIQSKNMKAELLRFPNRTTETGKTIDKYLKREIELTDEESRDLFSKNRWESVAHIIKLLEDGVTVIADRFMFSGICYPAATGIPIGECIMTERGLPLPDLVLYMDIEVELTNKREGFGDERFEDIELQKRTRNYFNSFYDPSYWVKINASKTMDEVRKDIEEKVDILLSTPCTKEISKF